MKNGGFSRQATFQNADRPAREQTKKKNKPPKPTPTSNMGGATKRGRTARATYHENDKLKVLWNKKGGSDSEGLSDRRSTMRGGVGNKVTRGSEMCSGKKGYDGRGIK